MWGRAVDCVILLSLQEHLQEESTRYCLSALGSQIAGGLCVASILVDFRTFKLRKSCGLLLSTSLVISHNDADNPIYRRYTFFKDLICGISLGVLLSAKIDPFGML